MCAASAERWPEAQYRIDARVAVADRALDARLQVAARDVHGAGQVAPVPLVGLAHVDEDDPVPEMLGHLGRIDLLHLALDLPDDLGSGRAHVDTS